MAVFGGGLLGGLVGVLVVGVCRARTCGGGGRRSQRAVSIVFIRSFGGARSLSLLSLSAPT